MDGLLLVALSSGEATIASNPLTPHRPTAQALRNQGLTGTRPDEQTPQHGPLVGKEHSELIRSFAVRRVHEIAEWLNAHKEARALRAVSGVLSSTLQEFSALQHVF